jgi:hypothetical protein
VPLPLGGTSNHFRAHLLRQLGAWDGYNVTEDCDLGLRMAFYGLKTAVLDSTTYEEANSQVHNWIRQRSRWIKGYMQTYLVYMRRPQVYLRPSRWAEFLSLQLFVGGKMLVLFINPLMWLLLLTYIGFHSLVTDLYHTLFPMPVLYMGVICLIFGNFFYTYSHLIGCMKRKQFHLLKWTLLIPVYWAMASVAAFLAFQQLIIKPHYWEKTQHGLHLRSAGSLPKITAVAEIIEQTSLIGTGLSASGSVEPAFDELPTLSLSSLTPPLLTEQQNVDPLAARLRLQKLAGQHRRTTIVLSDLVDISEETLVGELFPQLPERCYEEMAALSASSLSDQRSSPQFKTFCGSPSGPPGEEHKDATSR